MEIIERINADTGKRKANMTKEQLAAFRSLESNGPSLSSASNRAKRQQQVAAAQHVEAAAEEVASGAASRAAKSGASAAAPTTTGQDGPLQIGQNVSIYWKQRKDWFEGTIKSVSAETSASGDRTYKISVEYPKGADKSGAPVGVFSHTLPARDVRHVNDSGEAPAKRRRVK